MRSPSNTTAFAHLPREEEIEPLVTVELGNSEDHQSSDCRLRFGAVFEARSLERLPSLPTFSYLEASEEEISTRIAPYTRSAVRHGIQVQELFQNSPKDAMIVLESFSLVKLGTLRVTDSEALKAFGSSGILTRGCDTIDDPDWEAKWKAQLRDETAHDTSSLSVGWEERITLAAYAIAIKDIADRKKGALLQLLLQKYSSGATSQKIWKFPAVTAIISYHWETWSKPFLIGSFFLFMIWLISYVVYLIIYIETDIRHAAWNGHLFNGVPLLISLSHLFNLFCFLFMSPFAAELYLALHSQGWKFIQVKNLVDILATTLQLFIFIMHVINKGVGQIWFGYVLTLQCILLFTKVQNFGQVLGRSGYFSEVFIAVMYDARYLFFYILYSGLSAALCLGVLYKNDKGNLSSISGGDPVYIEELFGSFRRSLFVTFEVVFGSFDLNYILDVHHPWIKFLFFFGFQIMMTITVLNLLIAVMTQSYATVAKDQEVRKRIGRAEVIDKLSVLGIPNILSLEHKPYIHFLVIEQDDELPRIGSSSTRSIEDKKDTNSGRDLHQQQILHDLLLEMKRMETEHRKEMQNISSKLEMLIDQARKNEDSLTQLQ